VEYNVAFDAMERIAVGDFNGEALQLSIWKQDKGTWGSCELWRMHEIMTDQQEVAMFKTLNRSRQTRTVSNLARHVEHPFSEYYSAVSVAQGVPNNFACEGLDYHRDRLEPMGRLIL